MSIPQKNIMAMPVHVAIIMDGNGRWARRQGVPRIEGHRAGAETVRRMVEVCADLSIKYLTLYAFSTENWRRPQVEVRQLMNLLRDFLESRREDFDKYEVRLNAIGEIDRLPGLVRKKLTQVIAETQNYAKGTVTLALSYGSKNEIAAAARRLAEAAAAGCIKPENIDEKMLAENLYTADLPDPDLIIRTSGEQRLSNFLLWQASYAELWFTDTLWPDFSKEEFYEALEDYGRRLRRYGGHE